MRAARNTRTRWWPNARWPAAAVGLNLNRRVATAAAVGSGPAPAARSPPPAAVSRGASRCPRPARSGPPPPRSSSTSSTSSTRSAGVVPRRAGPRGSPTPPRRAERALDFKTSTRPRVIPPSTAPPNPRTRTITSRFTRARRWSACSRTWRRWAVWTSLSTARTKTRTATSTSPRRIWSRSSTWSR